jgi:hypothetical protein
VGRHLFRELKGSEQEENQQKQQDSAADTSALEAEIDRMVYDLYGLTEEEREIVEGGV